MALPKDAYPTPNSEIWVGIIAVCIGGLLIMGVAAWIDSHLTLHTPNNHLRGIHVHEQK